LIKRKQIYLDQKNNMNEKEQEYIPSKKILEKYAQVMVSFAVGSGKGVKKGDVVRLVASESSKPLYVEIMRELYRKGAHVISLYLPDDDENSNLSKDFYNLANDDQLNFYPKYYIEGIIKQIDHSINIISTADKNALLGIDPKKIMQRVISQKPFRDGLVQKEDKGEFTWTLCLYGTKAMAKEVGITEKEYWNQIIKACYLDKKDPVLEWKKAQKLIDNTINKLNKLDIKKLHIKGSDVDLYITIGKERQWLGGSGANIPSFEIFTSPDWRGTEGWIKFSEPLYRYGNVIKGVELLFEKGVVVKSKATKGEKVLKQMIATEGADKVGEFSLTDKRLSRITQFMAETLYDENVGGKNGNTHIALGNSYRIALKNYPKKLPEKKWKDLGFNISSVHTDIVSTTDRVVTAVLKNETEKTIYKDGMFVL